MALATVEHLTFAYPGAPPALRDVSSSLEPGEIVALLGPSGSGKSTLIRALAGLVPHFHGGRFAGSVLVGGRDTRRTRPADLAGTVATVFQDPEDQVVMTRVENEVAFGLENVGVPPREIWPRAERALEAVGAANLWGRRTAELSGGELQRVCLAAALALGPALLLLDEPTSQLDSEGAQGFLDAAAATGAAVVLSEQRVSRALEAADRVLFVEDGRLLLDASCDEALAWLETERPAWGAASVPCLGPADSGREVVTVDDVSYSYSSSSPPAVSGVSLTLRAGEIVALEGPNGSGKTTLARLVARLVEPDSGTVRTQGPVAYLSQDPGRYVVAETALDEVALGVRGDRARAREALGRAGLGWAADRHPRDLSSGERQRLGVAAVAVCRPDVLVLDEPTRGMDPVRKAELASWLQDEATRGAAVLVATHDATFPAHRRIRIGERTTSEELALAV